MTFSKELYELPEKGLRKLDTWAGQSTFVYEGCIRKGVTIHYGKEFSYNSEVSAGDLTRLLLVFGGKTVSMGTSRDNPPEGSVGKWLLSNVTKSALASYLGSILVYEGYAAKSGSNIRFF